ncbi:4-hydroxy-3-methylbut-2-enyl diphosphate reductase [Roseomonas sp. CAU 1739]|uniref:4-hydroxy-3-methylbut-2-enyl diphosphate reductase n=1 Tax=Roseomonas sp. CAU 1739 TaxID=3140364 RepID=UPI00325A743C
MWRPLAGEARTRLRVLLAQPRGFCAGVQRAIAIVDMALDRHGPGVHVRHEIVHNRHVVESLARRGAVFVEELDAVPDGTVTIFSAHGVPRSVEQEAARRGLPVIDATCPLVSRVHLEGRRYAAEGRVVLLIGHAGHPEVIGSLGQITGRVLVVSDVLDVARLDLPRDTPVAFVTQTTLSVDDTRATIAAIRARFADVVGPETRDICYATQNRQAALRALAAEVDVLIVVGAANSSNSNRLREIGLDCGVPTHLVADATALRPEWFERAATVGVTAGASAPESLVQGVVAALSRWADLTVEEQPGIVEDVRFRLPAALL